MTPNTPTRPDTPADQAPRPDELRKRDRIASTGDDFAHDNNASAEGNDASLIAGPSFVRRINDDGTVQAVPADQREEPAPAGPGESGARERSEATASGTADEVRPGPGPTR